MNYIEFKDIYRYYYVGDRKIAAVSGINFTIKKGEFTVILGQSGAGKTTVLNMLGGMDQASGGEIIVDGEIISNFDKRELTTYRRNKIGFIFQFYNLIATLTATENIELALQISKDPLSPHDALEKVGLLEKGDYFPSQLSGGEQQRISIARAIAKKPDILLCDEPTGALDAETGKEVIETLYNLCKTDGTTVIIITHNRAVAEIADRVIAISSGKAKYIKTNENPIPIESLVL